MANLDYSKLRSISARQIMRVLEKDGFVLARVTGSHHRYCHEDGRRVTVSFHSSGDIFKRDTLKSMLQLQAKWTEDDLKRLKLLK